jgi:hypothetical protein
MITSVFPVGVQRGTTVELTLAGKGDLSGGYALLFDGDPADFRAEFPDPKADAKADPKKADPKKADPKKADPKAAPKPDPKAPAKPANEVKVTLTVSAKAAVGVREFRLATPRGVSSIGLLVVGDEPETLEAEPNDVPAKAQAVAVPAAVEGRLSKNEDVDWFKFRAEAGQTLAFSVMSARLQDKIHDLQAHSDPMLTLTDAEGRELAGSDDHFAADPHFVHRFEKGGEYRVCVRDVRYQGNAAWTYRLTITARPLVLGVHPTAVRPGEPASLQPVTAEGVLPPVGLTVPADAAAGEVRTVQLPLPTGPSDPVSVWVSDLPLRVADEANDAPERAAGLAVPGAVAGRLAKALEADWYSFSAKKGEAFVFEVVARRLGSAADGLLSVHDAQGRSLAENDDAKAVVGITKDPQIAWTAPADGTYRLRVADVHGGGGPAFVYALTARRAEPDFAIRCDGDKIQIGPGGSGAWYPIIERTGGFDGPVTVEIRGLPAGVTASPLTIGPTMTRGCVVLTAAADAAVATARVRVVGTAVVKGPDGKDRTLVRTAQPLQEIYLPGGGRGLYPVDLQTVSVTGPSDIAVKSAAKAVTIAPGGTARIDVEVTRSPQYKGVVTLDVPLRHLNSVYADPLPPGVKIVEGKSKMRLGPNETKGWITLAADKDAQPVAGVPVAVVGYVSINFVIKVGYSTGAISLTVGR